MACPTCGEPAAFGPENRWRPFCSERCRVIDLGAWANESYRIPAKPDESEDAEPGTDVDPENRGQGRNIS